MTSEQFIVKVQMPVASNVKNPPALVYNKDRSIEQEFLCVEGLRKVMGDKFKKYFYARVDNDELVLTGEAPYQEW